MLGEALQEDRCQKRALKANFLKSPWTAMAIPRCWQLLQSPWKVMKVAMMKTMLSPSRAIWRLRVLGKHQPCSAAPTSGQSSLENSCRKDPKKTRCKPRSNHEEASHKALGQAWHSGPGQRALLKTSLCTKPPSAQKQSCIQHQPGPGKTKGS